MEKNRGFAKTYNYGDFFGYTSYEAVLVHELKKGKKMSQTSSHAENIDVLEIAGLVSSRSLGETESDELELYRDDSIYYDLDCEDDGEHRYETASRLRQQELDVRDLERTNGREYVEISFSAEVTSRNGNFHGLESLASGGGGISNLRLYTAAGDYTLTIGTCGELAPGWVTEANHNRPMWILHCPDLPISHIEGCCFFDGLAYSSLGASNHLSEDKKISRNFVSWNLGKFDKVLAPVSPLLLESLRDANEHEGSILIAFIGSESCVLTPTSIPVGMVEWLTEYECSVMTAKDGIDCEECELRLLAENAAHKRLVNLERVHRKALPIGKAGVACAHCCKDGGDVGPRFRVLKKTR